MSTSATAEMTRTTDPTVSTTDNSTQKIAKTFDLQALRDAFVNCIENENTLILSEYVRAYEELCVFVASLGAVFEWATKDLSFKLVILREHLRFDPINYHSIQSMIDYEIESGRILNKDTNLQTQLGKPLPNGCRTLLRLHRALAFIAAFLTEMSTATDEASSASIAWNAYSATMARFHSWPVKHTIRAALKLTLPSRQDLISKFAGSLSSEEIDRYSEEIIRSCNIIERTTQELFETHNLTKLP